MSIVFVGNDFVESCFLELMGGHWQPGAPALKLKIIVFPKLLFFVSSSFFYETDADAEADTRMYDSIGIMCPKKSAPEAQKSSPKFSAAGQNFSLDMTWERLILLCLSKKRPKNTFQAQVVSTTGN